MSDLLQNIRIGIRSLRRSPGFALTAILTLALGIGLAIAVFTVAEAFLLRPLPMRDQDRVVVMWPSNESFRSFRLSKRALHSSRG